MTPEEIEDWEAERKRRIWYGRRRAMVRTLTSDGFWLSVCVALTIGFFTWLYFYDKFSMSRAAAVIAEADAVMAAEIRQTELANQDKKTTSVQQQENEVAMNKENKEVAE